MPILGLPIAYKGITLTELPGKIAVYFAIAGCTEACPECHSKELWNCNVPYTSVNDICKYASAQVDAGAEAIILMGGTTNGIAQESLRKIIRELGMIAPVCVYSGSDNELINDWVWSNTDITWLKTGSYHADLGGLDSPTTNQKFYKMVICPFEDSCGNVGVIYKHEDLTHLFRGGKTKCRK